MTQTQRVLYIHTLIFSDIATFGNCDWDRLSFDCSFRGLWALLTDQSSDLCHFKPYSTSRWHRTTERTFPTASPKTCRVVLSAFYGKCWDRIGNASIVRFACWCTDRRSILVSTWSIPSYNPHRNRRYSGLPCSQHIRVCSKRESCQDAESIQSGLGRCD